MLVGVGVLWLCRPARQGEAPVKLILGSFIGWNRAINKERRKKEIIEYYWPTLHLSNFAKKNVLGRDEHRQHCLNPAFALIELKPIEKSLSFIKLDSNYLSSSYLEWNLYTSARLVSNLFASLEAAWSISPFPKPSLLFPDLDKDIHNKKSSMTKILHKPLMVFVPKALHRYMNLKLRKFSTSVQSSMQTESWSHEQMYQYTSGRWM